MKKNNNNWKACVRQKRTGGSNPPHSAQTRLPPNILGGGLEVGKRWQRAAKSSTLTAEQPQMRKTTVNLYFGRSFDKNGTSPLLLCVNHASSSCYIAIPGVRLRKDQWDAKRKKVVNHPRADTINSVMLSTLGKANEAVLRLGSTRGMTCAKVRDMIADYIYPSDSVDIGVVATMTSYMEACERTNTKDKFQQTLNHLVRWLGERKAKSLQFRDVDVDWLNSFDRYLVASCPSVNSRSIHLRNIRTVFNHAINHELTTAHYPFRQYKIKSAPANPTPLTLEQLKVLWHYQPKHESQAYWLDLWRLIFALIGINITDIAHLVRISQNRVNYTRQKTGRLYSVKVEPIAMQLIEAHRGRNTLVDILDRYKSVHVATHQCNMRLKEIATALKLPPITTYTARYTWATLALSIDTPIEVISQALGHSYGQAVTLGYIMPDRRKVDEANKKVLALLK